jgi:hypothetical protein
MESMQRQSASFDGEQAEVPTSRTNERRQTLIVELTVRVRPRFNQMELIQPACDGSVAVSD